MSGIICRSCRSYLKRQASKARCNNISQYSTSAPSKPLDIAALLSKPTWSVRSLLPDPSKPPHEEITPTQLSHLLRLSALPQPKSPEQEAKMLSTLHSQLHFVRDIQSVDTKGVEPLQSIRDETPEGLEEITIGLGDLKEAFEMEEIVGRMGRPRRRKEKLDVQEVEIWDVLREAKDTVKTPSGEFFVVRGGNS